MGQLADEMWEVSQLRRELTEAQRTVAELRTNLAAERKHRALETERANSLARRVRSLNKELDGKCKDGAKMRRALDSIAIVLSRDIAAKTATENTREGYLTASAVVGAVPAFAALPHGPRE